MRFFVFLTSHIIIVKCNFSSQALVALKVINNLYCGVTTVELDNMAAEHAICLSHEHKDYGMLAARIEVSNLHKETKKTFSGKKLLLKIIYNNLSDISNFIYFYFLYFRGH